MSFAQAPVQRLGLTAAKNCLNLVLTSLLVQDQPVKLAIVMKVIGRTGSRGQVINAIYMSLELPWKTFCKTTLALLTSEFCFYLVGDTSTCEVFG